MLSLKIIPENHGLYSILLKLDQSVEIQIGRRGLFLFQPGIYIYIGSAKGRMESRIKRHLKIEKKQRWHFDYLRPYGSIMAIISFPISMGECQLRKDFINKNQALQMPIAKFGSSDCKCYSHLLYSNKLEELSFLKNEEMYYLVYGKL